MLGRDKGKHQACWKRLLPSRSPLPHHLLNLVIRRGTVAGRRALRWERGADIRAGRTTTTVSRIMQWQRPTIRRSSSTLASRRNRRPLNRPRRRKTRRSESEDEDPRPHPEYEEHDDGETSTTSRTLGHVHVDTTQIPRPLSSKKSTEGAHRRRRGLGAAARTGRPSTTTPHRHEPVDIPGKMLLSRSSPTTATTRATTRRRRARPERTSTPVMGVIVYMMKVPTALCFTAVRR